MTIELAMRFVIIVPAIPGRTHWQRVRASHQITCNYKSNALAMRLTT